MPKASKVCNPGSRPGVDGANAPCAGTMLTIRRRVSIPAPDRVIAQKQSLKRASHISHLTPHDSMLLMSIFSFSSSDFPVHWPWGNNIAVSGYMNDSPFISIFLIAVFKGLPESFKLQGICTHLFCNITKKLCSMR